MGRTSVEVRGLPVLATRASALAGRLHEELTAVPIAAGEPSNDELLALERAERLP